MTLIDDIKRDREASADGDWTLETVPTSCGVCHKVGAFPSNGVHAKTPICVYEDRPPTTAPSKIEPIARRIARVPDLEAQVLADARIKAAAVKLAERLADSIVYMDSREKMVPGMPRVCDMAREDLADFKRALEDDPTEPEWDMSTAKLVEPKK